jgi:hypothetical protein
MQHLIAELNRSEIAKNGEGRRAYYSYVRQGIHSLDLMKRVAHELEAIFTRQALELEQWRSRFHAGQALPGISEDEAATIVHSELGSGLSQAENPKADREIPHHGLAERGPAQLCIGSAAVLGDSRVAGCRQRKNSRSLIASG